MTTTSEPVHAAAASRRVSMGPGPAVLSPSTMIEGPAGSPPRNRNPSSHCRTTCLVSPAIALGPQSLLGPWRNPVVIPDRDDGDGRRGPGNRPQIRGVHQEGHQGQNLRNGDRLSHGACWDRAGVVRCQSGGKGYSRDNISEQNAYDLEH